MLEERTILFTGKIKTLSKATLISRIEAKKSLLLNFIGFCKLNSLINSKF